MKFAEFDRRPVIVALAGPNGAGKTTFYHSHLRHAALPFINADVLALLLVKSNCLSVKLPIREVLFGALAMQQFGIRPVPDEERLDMTHYTKEFVEF